MVHANLNPILESRQYFVELKDVTEAELTSNATAKSMYDQCDPDGNQYLCLIPYSISAAELLLFVMMNKNLLIMDALTCAYLQLTGSYSANGRTALNLGKSQLT